MLNLKQQLPPLNALITFEAAARHLSFTLAANELNVTQAAVSRQIKNLEQHLGVALFNRYNRRLTLTIAAQQLLPNLLSAIALIIDSVNELTAVDTRKTVTIAATIAFTTFKLNAWLSQFMQQHPNIEVRVIATDRDVDLQREGVDLAISYGDDRSNSSLRNTFMFNDEIFPVCSPEFLDSAAIHSAELPLQVADLLQQPLLHLDEEHWRGLHYKAIDWGVWFRSQGLIPPRRLKGLKINNYPLLLQAVLKGQGIALGWRHLVSDFLDTGELIAPVTASYQSQREYYLARKADCNNPDVATLQQWILRCATTA